MLECVRFALSATAKSDTSDKSHGRNKRTDLAPLCLQLLRVNRQTGAVRKTMQIEKRDSCLQRAVLDAAFEVSD